MTNDENVSWRRIAATLLLIGIALGAFGSHFLPEKFGDAFNPATWHTAVFYHLIHGLALFVIALRGEKSGRFVRIAWLIGILCFSGSLYVMAINPIRWLGPVTPLGGLAFMLGWATLIFRKSV